MNLLPVYFMNLHTRESRILYGSNDGFVGTGFVANTERILKDRMVVSDISDIQ